MNFEKVLPIFEAKSVLNKVILSIFCAITITSCSIPLETNSLPQKDEALDAPETTLSKRLVNEFGYFKDQVKVETSFLDSLIKKVETIKPLTIENTPNAQLLTYGDQEFSKVFNSEYDKKT
jgi:hypothetical protein